MLGIVHDSLKHHQSLEEQNQCKSCSKSTSLVKHRSIVYSGPTVNAILQLGWVGGSEVVLKANKMMTSDCSAAKSWKNSSSHKRKMKERLLALTVW